MIDVRIHSSRHLETKITYQIPENKAYEKELHYYIFTPAQLHVSGDLISDEAMLRKFQTHARYSSPEITLDELLDSENRTSPLIRLEKYVKVRISGESGDIGDIIFINELQTLGNSIRHEAGVMLSECKTLTTNKQIADLSTMLGVWNVEISEVLLRFRRLLETMHIHYPTGNHVISAFEWTDEALSLIVENTSLEMYLSLEPLFSEIQESAYTLLRLSRMELSYRRERKYESVVSKNNKYSSEAVSYRSGVLKKWTQSVLYLTPIPSKAPQRVANMFAGTAAAIAMTFATLAAIFAEAFFIRNSMQWSLLVIFAYVFKDRIKEGLRIFFGRIVPRLLADQISSFVSPRTGKNLSKAKILIDITKATKVPQKIQEVRRFGSNPFQDMLPIEDVIHYTRYVKVFKTERNKVMGPWINAITVITRIRIDDWLKEMDDPNDVMYRVESVDGEFEQQNAQRVYHLHLILEETSKKDKTSQFWHYRLILNKQGIVRLEKILEKPV
jgi:hypothetical protein